MSNGLEFVAGKVILTVDEMSERLRVKKTWLYRQVMIPESKGGVPRIKLKKYLRFDPEKVFQWVEAQNAAQAA